MSLLWMFERNVEHRSIFDIVTHIGIIIILTINYSLNIDVKWVELDTKFNETGIKNKYMRLRMLYA